MSTLNRMFSRINPANNARLIAGQLRKPHGIFASNAGKKMNESNQRLYQLVLGNICSNKGDHMLEIGFGNGKYFADFLSLAAGIKMDGVELSASMLKEAAVNNSAFIANGSLQLKLVNSAELPFADNHFDAVIAVNLIYFWDDPMQHLQEIYRVLKPGGRFYIGIRPAEVLCKLPFAQYGFHLLSRAAWIEIIQAAQLQFIHCQVSKEPDITIAHQTYTMSGECLVFEK